MTTALFKLILFITLCVFAWPLAAVWALVWCIGLGMRLGAEDGKLVDDSYFEGQENYDDDA